MKLAWTFPCRSALAIGLAALLISNVPAYAHNERVHSGMVDLSYEIMKGMEKNQFFQVQQPAGMTQADWLKFINAVAKAPGKLRKMQTELPLNDDPACGNQAPPSNWAQGQMGDIKYAVHPLYNRQSATHCGVWSDWTPGGIFDQINNARDGMDYTGTVLGFWTANVDANYDDTHLWHRPTNAAAQGALKNFVNQGVNIIGAVLLAPFICLGELFAGNPSGCLADSLNAGDTLNPLDEIDGLWPGFGDIKGDDYVGFWHHIQILGGPSNEYDDHQGLLFSEAGPYATMDKVDLGIIALLDLGGISVAYDKSLGPKNYESKGGDGLPATVHRSKSKWQFTTAAHTPMEPVDNLGDYGWGAFMATKSLAYLGYPLHALGDATVPMHVAATPAWGHRPFEDAADRDWSALRLADASDPDQKNMVADILHAAARYYTEIKASPFGVVGDIPVRKLVTDVASHTASYSQAKQPVWSWPFNSKMSYLYKFDGSDGKEVAIQFYQANTTPDRYYPVLVDGVGALVAFLTAASEVL